MDYNKFSRIGNKNPQTRSDTFLRQPDDLQDWKAIIQSQSGPGKKEKIAWNTKEALPVIGEISPRSLASSSTDNFNNLVSGRNALMSTSFYTDTSDIAYDDTDYIKRKNVPPVYGRYSRNNGALSKQGLLTRSMDVFPTHISPRTRQLRPLGPKRLTSVPEIRGASAFRPYLQALVPDLPERPNGPSPYSKENIDYERPGKHVVEIPGYTIPNRMDRLQPSPSCPASTPEPIERNSGDTNLPCNKDSLKSYKSNENDEDENDNKVPNRYVFSDMTINNKPTLNEPSKRENEINTENNNGQNKKRPVLNASTANDNKENKENENCVPSLQITSGHCTSGTHTNFEQNLSNITETCTNLTNTPPPIKDENQVAGDINSNKTLIENQNQNHPGSARKRRSTAFIIKEHSTEKPSKQAATTAQDTSNHGNNASIKSTNKVQQADKVYNYSNL